MSGSRRRPSIHNPKSRKGQYNRRKKEEIIPEKDILDQLTSSDSSNPGSPLCQSTPSKSGVEPPNASQSGSVENYLSISLLSSNLNISFFPDQKEDDNESESTVMGLEESFLNYTIIDPSPDDPCDFLDLDHENFDILNFDDPVQNYLLSSDEEESDIELDELLKYCEGEEAAECDKQAEVSQVTGFLREWSVQNSISLLALSRLTKGLKERHSTCFSALPVDGRTIMRTPVEKLNMIDVPPGKYVHIGVRKQLNFIASIITEKVDHLGLLFNIDGVKLYKHTQWSLYPILMMVPSCRSLKNKVFPVGLYYGEGKPGNMDLFLQPFIDEMLELLVSADFSMNGEMVKILLLGFCCDTPARSEILETVGHSGYFSCFRCVTKGTNVTLEVGEKSTHGKKRRRGRGIKRGKSCKRVFPEVNAPPREDQKFRNKLYSHHQPAKKRLTPLVQLPGLHFTRSFILDPMHLVFLGVTKSILSTLFLGGPHMLKPSLRQKVQNKLEDCVPFLPSEFRRKPTQIKNVGTCKATEARLYLFYLGPVILKNSVDREKYIHFMELSIAMRIYHHVTFCADSEARKFARELLEHFVASVPNVYGEMYASHNIHSLQHFPDDVEWFIDCIPDFTANDISAFAPENFNQVFRRFTRGYAKPLQQNFRRLAELFETDFWRQKYIKNMHSSDEIEFKKNHSDGPLSPLLKGRQYKEAIFLRFSLSVDQADCTCGTASGDVIVSLNFVDDKKNKEQFVVGKKFELKCDFFDDPLPNSKKLGILKVSKLSNIVEKWSLSSIVTKYVRLPYIKDETLPLQYRKQEFIVLPLLHSEAGPSTS